ncbi:GNAT family N-acetyltransferase [Chlorogloeopsis fritschii PCC 9212]|uniref:N-acetyltransferase n=1 Tax=Chlorogloeopsis fritschii PCC 6912 TaxID=211165 RepID=A0A3S1FVJ3_CHLFR|nr:GNAT family N-acetyltransferase [Chlorogloeopsis fritschii]RUR86769.1 N-acetyltransferase [Chlorogloeopsis fritschii PCC 6912]
MQLPLYKILKNGIRAKLDRMHSEEQEEERKLLNLVIVEGKTYPQNQLLSQSEFVNYWLSLDAFVVKVESEFTIYEPIVETRNFASLHSGRCSHICNAGFIVQPQMRGQGIGRFMGEAMLEIAGSLGFEAVMFNLVFASNIASINLWKSLEFETIGRIKNGVKLDAGEVVDALIMYRQL